jgi:hypothetical protein
MILEGLVTTLNAYGAANISPMGPMVDERFDRIMLRPYLTSTTYANLKRTGAGVLHVTDDVLLLAQAAVGQPDPPPALLPAKAIEGVILADACRWYAFHVVSIDDRQPRVEIAADVVDRGTLREFFGFNRAKHAVVEAAILATRIALLPRAEIEAELDRLAVPVQKTGGSRELQAFEFLRNYVRHATRQDR